MMKDPWYRQLVYRCNRNRLDVWEWVQATVPKLRVLHRRKCALVAAKYATATILVGAGVKVTFM